MALPVAPVAAILLTVFVVVLVLFALAIVFAAIWYHLRVPKEVRLDEEGEEGQDGEDDEVFVMRPE